MGVSTSRQDAKKLVDGEMTPEEYMARLVLEAQANYVPPETSQSSSTDGDMGSDEEGADSGEEDAGDDFDPTDTIKIDAKSKDKVKLGEEEQKHREYLKAILGYNKLPKKIKSTRKYIKYLAEQKDKEEDNSKYLAVTKGKVAAQFAKDMLFDYSSIPEKIWNAKDRYSKGNKIGGHGEDEVQQGGLFGPPKMTKNPLMNSLVQTFDVERNYLFPKHDIVMYVIDPQRLQFADVFQKLYNEQLVTVLRRPELLKKGKLKDDSEKAMEPIFVDEIQKPIMELAVREYQRVMYQNLLIRISQTPEFQGAFKSQEGSEPGKLKAYLENIPAMREFLADKSIRDLLDTFRTKRKNFFLPGLLGTEKGADNLRSIVSELVYSMKNFDQNKAYEASKNAPAPAAEESSSAPTDTPTDAPTDAPTPPGGPSGGGGGQLHRPRRTHRHQPRRRYRVHTRRR